MRIARRTKTIAFSITLGACMLAAAVTLNVSWIILNWREVVPLVLGVIFFMIIIAGLVLNTVFLVREIRRNEQQDSFLNAVTHELKTPIASIRLYLETLQRRDVAEAQRKEFYRIMVEDADRLLSTVEQVLKAGEVRERGTKGKNWQELDFSSLVKDTAELARLRHNLAPEALRFQSATNNGITVMGSTEELRTAIANIFDNAVKYSRSEKQIIADLLTPDIDTVLLRVRDNGVGIAQPELKRIFKRFYRVHLPAM